jgi:hypothetical protein
MTFLEKLLHSRSSFASDNFKLRDPKYWPCYNCSGIGRTIKPVDPSNYDIREYKSESCDICKGKGSVSEEEYLRWFLRRTENMALFGDFIREYGWPEDSEDSVVEEYDREQKRQPV